MLYGSRDDIGFACGRKSQEPEDAIGHPFENVHPGFQSLWVDLVELVEVAVDYRVLGQAVLRPGGEWQVGRRRVDVARRLRHLRLLKTLRLVRVGGRGRGRGVSLL